MTSPLDDALLRTSEAVARYKVPEDMIALAAGSLMQMPAEVRVRSEVTALADAVLEIATVHEGPHDDCTLCHSVGNGLAVAMAVIRVETDVELRRMFESGE